MQSLKTIGILHQNKVTLFSSKQEQPHYVHSLSTHWKDFLQLIENENIAFQASNWSSYDVMI
jgi:hypothetical protein